MVALFAFAPWPTMLVLIGIAAIIWLLFRAVVDGITWFREEILEDYRQRKKRK
ncbi:MAG: hypothetical protein HQ567_05035 [Candidatus Nealsonbacteria bacterium]|nr:hypothetical protein [Candidatus Nealsonbacteria bacterium]